MSTVIFDKDSILNNMFESWMQVYSVETGLHFDTDDLVYRDVHRSLPKSGLDPYSILERPNFFLHQQPVLPAIREARLLHEAGHKVLVYTACDQSPVTYWEKAHWINHYLPFLPNRNKIIGGNWKHLMKADVFIDDSGENMTAFRANNPDALIMSPLYPYNKDTRAADLLAPDYKDLDGAWKCIHNMLVKRNLLKG